MLDGIVGVLKNLKNHSLPYDCFHGNSGITGVPMWPEDKGQEMKSMTRFLVEAYSNHTGINYALLSTFFWIHS